MREEWKDFVAGDWTRKIDVRDFINRNINPYDGDESFLLDKSEKTTKVWNKCEEL